MTDKLETLARDASRSCMTIGLDRRSRPESSSNSIYVVETENGQPIDHDRRLNGSDVGEKSDR